MAELLLRAGCDTSSVTSIPALMEGFFVSHLEEQQGKMVALAGGLHRRLGAESVVLKRGSRIYRTVSGVSSSLALALCP